MSDICALIIFNNPSAQNMTNADKVLLRDTLEHVSNLCKAAIMRPPIIKQSIDRICQLALF